MQLYGVLVLVLTLSTAFGLRCYECETRDVKTCTKIETCPPNADRCGILDVHGLIAKGCIGSGACQAPVKCCEGDLCNGATTTGSAPSEALQGI